MGDTGARGLSSFGFTSVSWGHDGQKVEVKRIITQREYKVRHVAAAAAVLRVVWFGLVWLGLVGFGAPGTACARFGCSMRAWRC